MSIAKNFCITGGAGFIGSHMVELLLGEGHKVTILDSLTYAADKGALATLVENPKVNFVHGRIQNSSLVKSLLEQNEIDILINFAAETHVDNSINSPSEFIESNIRGTFELLSVSQRYFEQNPLKEFKFIQISTDEVFGEVNSKQGAFSERSPYNPRSPYSASKASSDHLVRAWHNTYGLPAIITHCSNNFGPRQNREKLIPKIISNALKGENIPIYGDGKNIRDWLYVKDHCRGIYLATQKGNVGESYCFGGGNQFENIEIASMVCMHLDTLKPLDFGKSYREQIEFVIDRKGHDRHYAVNFQKAKEQLGYRPEASMDGRLRDTVRSYL